ncbi:hypothetical protein Sjap_010572 [Stephania japonica]|uniref:Uncharacterized protein n=1 Tax=Stephania japonica TaxID=461633 RepID=A0AAP0JAQ1_9MAGN
MAKKRKSEATGLDEADRTTYTTFCGAANSLSQLYTQAMNQQKLAFQAGERRALNEHDRGADEPPVLPGPPFPHQNPQHMMQYPATSVQVSNGSFGQACIAQGPRFVPSANGGRNSSNETSFFLDQSREFNSGASNDSSMDMHADTPDPYADY